MDKVYKDIIFTNHALARMKSRSISQHHVWQTLQKPEKTTPEEKPHTTRFVRTINERRYHVIAAYLPEEKKNLVISAWVRGEEDAVPLSWQLITLPFKIIWKILDLAAKQLKK